MTTARTLIVNADDFGLTPGVSRGILEAGATGIVTSTTLIVNRPIDPELIGRLKASGLGAGLHLNLTLGTPLSDPRRVPSLVDGEGRFIRDPREAASRADKDEARIELGNQIDAFRALMGCFPTHLDSHHHSHRLPVVLDAVVSVAREHGLPVRRSSDRIAERLHDARLSTTSTFIEAFFGEGATLDRLREIVATLPHGTHELMCHPGHSDAALRAESGYADFRERELQVLCDPAAREAVRAAGVELIHFGSGCGF